MPRHLLRRAPTNPDPITAPPAQATRSTQPTNRDLPPTAAEIAIAPGFEARPRAAVAPWRLLTTRSGTDPNTMDTEGSVVEEAGEDDMLVAEDGGEGAYELEAGNGASEEEEEEEEEGEEDDEEEVEGEDAVMRDRNKSPSPLPPNLREISSLASWTVSTHKPGCGVAALRHPSPSQFWQSDGPQPHTLTLHFFKLVAIVKIRVYLDFELDESYTPTKMVFLAGMGGNDLVEFASWEGEGPCGWANISLEGVGGRSSSWQHFARGPRRRRKLTMNRTGKMNAQNGQAGLEVEPQGDYGDDDGNDDNNSYQEEDRDHDNNPFNGNVLKAMVIQVRICENHQNGKDTHVRGFQVFSRHDDHHHHRTTPAATIAPNNPNHSNNTNATIGAGTASTTPTASATQKPLGISTTRKTFRYGGGVGPDQARSATVGVDEGEEQEEEEGEEEDDEDDDDDDDENNEDEAEDDEAEDDSSDINHDGDVNFDKEDDQSLGPDFFPRTRRGRGKRMMAMIGEPGTGMGVEEPDWMVEPVIR